MSRGRFAGPGQSSMIRHQETDQQQNNFQQEVVQQNKIEQAEFRRDKIYRYEAQSGSMTQVGLGYCDEIPEEEQTHGEPVP